MATKQSRHSLKNSNFQTPQKIDKNLMLLTKLVSHEICEEQDLKYAESQLKHIYSCRQYLILEQLSKILQQKKYYLKNLQNQQRNQNQFQLYNKAKLQKLQAMRVKSIQKRQKLLKDRVKVYANNDEKWFNKKQQIKRRLKKQDESFIQKSKVQQKKSQSFWKIKQHLKIKTMKELSKKYHFLYNSNYTNSNSSQRLKNDVSPLNDRQQEYSHLTELLHKKTSTSSIQKYRQLRSNTLNSFNKQREKQKQFRIDQQREKLQKVIIKLNKIQKSQQKRLQIKKRQRSQKAKLKNSFKVYKNKKKQIGQECNKYAVHHQKYRNKTENTQRMAQESDINFYNNKINASQRNQHLDKPMIIKQQKLMKYYEQTKRFKIAKILKTNVRTMLNTQFKKIYQQKI